MLKAPFARLAAARDQRFSPTGIDLAVVAIFRQESPFLDEWLTFHSGVGVDHFYLYNNFSQDDFRDVLAPWIARGKVTLCEWPKKVGQLSAYRHCVRHHAEHARWMAFIDIDEYLFAPGGSIKDAPLSEAPGIMVFSPYFGSSGHEKKPASPIARAFTMRAPLSRISAKTIANPRLIYAIRNVHSFKYWRGQAVDPLGRPFNADQPDLSILRLNHYWSRSLDDLREKISRGDASTATPRDSAWHFEFEKQLNQEEDTTIIPVIDRIFSERSAVLRS